MVTSSQNSNGHNSTPWTVNPRRTWFTLRKCMWDLRKTKRPGTSVSASNSLCLENYQSKSAPDTNLFFCRWKCV